VLAAELERLEDATTVEHLSVSNMASGEFEEDDVMIDSGDDAALNSGCQKSVRRRVRSIRVFPLSRVLP
jgi:hypothetical protein